MLAEENYINEQLLELKIEADDHKSALHLITFRRSALVAQKKIKYDKVRSLKVKLRKRLEKKALEQVSDDVGKHPAKEMKAMKGRKKTK